MKNYGITNYELIAGSDQTGIIDPSHSVGGRRSYIVTAGLMH